MRASPIVPVTVAFCLLLIPVELGWIPFLRNAWALNLWQYLPWPITLVLAASLVALCIAGVRERIADRVEAALEKIGPRPEVKLGVASLVLLPFLFWLLRERLLFGDSPILLMNAASGSQFLFPDVGATFLLQLCHRIGRSFGVHVQPVAQAAVAVAGGIAVACAFQVGARIAPSPARGVLATVLILCGGLTRVLAGHVEVYAFLLACGAAYYWSVLAALRDRTSTFWPALLAGVAIWMHLSGIFLLPSLVVLVALVEPRFERSRALLKALGVAAAPSILFLLAMWMGGHDAELAQAWRTMLRWTGLEPSPVGHEAFLRGWFAEPGAGTRYVVLSAGHLKYLANAFFLLAPFAVPVLIAFALGAPRRLLATPEARVLATAAVSLLAYTSVVRPVWGPYDWDLFSLTATTLAILAAHLLVSALDARTLAHVGILVVGATLLTVTISFLAIGIAPANDAGPFAIDGLAAQAGESPIDALERILGRWL